VRLTFAMSAHNTAQRMIRFSDGKASFAFLFFGIILSIFGIRGDRILSIVGGQVHPGALRLVFIRLGILSDEVILQEMVHELCAAMRIERGKFAQIARCLRRAVASFIVWVAPIVMTVAT